MMSITAITDASLTEAAACLKKGGLVAFPTETVYGLGAIATDDSAVVKIFAAKNRPQFNPLISHFADKDSALKAGRPNKIAEKLAVHFWPGPLTLILERPADSPISLLASAGSDSLAVRVPGHADALRLLGRVGLPVVAPSANRSGRISPSEARHVADGLGDKCDIILDGGRCQRGLESTVIDCRGNSPLLLRPGPITLEQIYTETGLDVAAPANPPDRNTAPLVAPGQLASHYAPSARVRLNAADIREDEIFVGFGALPKGVISEFNLSPDGDLHEAAARLFALMHLADKRGVKSIAFAPVPMSGLGLAINDRLARAAAPRMPE
jgi:L-threonylcarbamoyladenylate synthase